VEASTIRRVVPEKRRKFDGEFREGAVRLVRETGKPIAAIARDLGVNEGTLGNSVVKDKAAREGLEGLSGDDAAELKGLRAENAELRMERDVLKRSVVLWVKDRRSERGPFHRRPEHQLPGAAHADLSAAGGEPVLVLQVAGPAGHAAAAAGDRAGRRRRGHVR
jgi:transposase